MKKIYIVTCNIRVQLDSLAHFILCVSVVLSVGILLLLHFRMTIFSLPLPSIQLHVLESGLALCT